MAVMRTGLTPLEPLAAQLAAQKQQAGRTRAVLVATGSFSPIHRMHIVQFEMARTFLASCHAVDVILGYISPSHDSYLRGKLGEEAIPYEDRVEMCKLAIKDHFTQNPTNDGFTIVVDQWEGHQAFFIDFPDVSDHQRSYLTSKFPQEKFLVLLFFHLSQHNTHHSGLFFTGSFLVWDGPLPKMLSRLHAVDRCCCETRLQFVKKIYGQAQLRDGTWHWRQVGVV
eukprot:TRINITY_DN2063_c0_g1_i3.p1 TRINITY_DN2063_c0_g1~~TRINITY_DN2063_c0_g1_i3.p1  ORF type:complete len:225 (+),score=30.12 TRINITY_DN2063_c0_g1_i3:277-951(+)